MMSARETPKCPVCGWATMPIIYGLPTPELAARDDIILGGCVVQELDPNLACSKCDWTGQDWYAGAPLMPNAWVLLDRSGSTNPIGLVAGRFDDVHETFQLGNWFLVGSQTDFDSWCQSAGDHALALTAPFGDLSPALIAQFRSGWDIPDLQDLYASGFVGLAGGVPKFRFSSQTAV